MNLFTNILGLLITSALAENVFFCRCFLPDIGRMQSQESEGAAPHTVLCAAMCLPAALGGWLGHLIFASRPEVPVYLSVPVSVLIYIALFIMLYHLLRVLFGARGASFSEGFPRESFAFLPMGVLLLTCLGSYQWYESLIFGIGSGIGYLLAAWLYAQFTGHLKYSRPPFFLRGLPLQLIGIGLISLALFGLLGHSLTA